ncbi:MAG: hypothetical protein KDD25_01510 [Bdellovibrionales bacterium]|nr:hypothetical protein [Bdellovibrionales bacterium]
MKYNLILGFTALVATLTLSHRSEACLQTPKEIQLSETTYQDVAHITYGTNCYVNLSVNDDNYTRSFQMKNYDNSEVLCAFVYPQKDGRSDYDNKKEFCGDQLKNLNAADRSQLFTIRDRSGVAKGEIQYDGSKLEVLSYDRGATRDRPYLSADIKSVQSEWIISANQREGDKVGSFELKDSGCTRSLGEPKSDQALDLRGNQVSTTDGGCHAGVDVKPFAARAEKRAVFSVEGAQ